MPVRPEHLHTAIELAKQYGARKLILFGSALEAPDKAYDLDLACDLPGLDLFAYAGRLEENLSLPVDVIPLMPGTLFVHYIEQQGKVLYEAA